MPEAYLEPSQTSKMKPSEAVVQSYSVKSCLEILQNSQENTCARPATSFKRDSDTGVFL